LVPGRQSAILATVLETIPRLAWLIAVTTLSIGCDPGAGPIPTDDDDSAEPAGLPQVASMEVLREPAGRVSWGHATEQIAFDRMSEDEVYDVFVMDDDGGAERCITCDEALLPRTHKGNPDWHPVGDTLAIMVEKVDHPAGTSALSTPGLGLYNDLWLVAADGSAAWPLTELATDGVPTGVLHPHFSHDGERLLWAERVGTGGLWGEWAIKVAQLRWEGGTPTLVDEVSYQPGEQHEFVETHGWSPDDRRVVFTGNLDEGQSVWGTDLYWLELETGALQRLTDTPEAWDELASVTPDGGTIVWNSGQGDTSGDDGGPPTTEYWIMRSDGSQQQRLTYFNDPASEHYTGERIVVADSEFGPDGERLVAYVIADGDRYTGRLLLMELQ